MGGGNPVNQSDVLDIPEHVAERDAEKRKEADEDTVNRFREHSAQSPSPLHCTGDDDKSSYFDPMDPNQVATASTTSSTHRSPANGAPTFYPAPRQNGIVDGDENGLTRAVLESTSADGVPRGAIDQFFLSRDELNQGSAVAEILVSGEGIGKPATAEQDLAIVVALDNWFPEDEIGASNWTAAEDLLLSLSESNDQELYVQATNIYVDRAIELVRPGEGVTATQTDRLTAASIAGCAMYALGTSGDSGQQAAFIDARGDEDIAALVDALALDEGTGVFNDSWFGMNQDRRIYSVSALVVGLEAGRENAPASRQSYELSRCVFNNLPGDCYHIPGIENNFAAALTADWQSGAESQPAAQLRVSEVLGTNSGRDLLGYSEGVSSDDRTVMISLFRENPDWDADMLRSHGDSGWNNPTVNNAFTKILADR